MTCTECRSQYEKSGRGDQVPCDIGKCKYSPSPGDTSETGCGLLPENEFAVWFHPRWKAFGEIAFQIIEGPLTPQTGSLLEKLLLIEEYVPHIAEAREKRLETRKPRSKRRKK